MAMPVSVGTCALCRGSYRKDEMAHHFTHCPGASVVVHQPGKPPQPARVLHLVVEGRDKPDYWLHLEVPEDATLVTLDNFLRDLWLECCGHLSQFAMHGKRYVVLRDPTWPDPHERSMRGVKLGTVFDVGQSADYDYDFGSTTHLVVRCIGERTAMVRNKAIRILARNDPPKMVCAVCGGQATQICTDCQWSHSGFFCATCGEDHDCGPDFLLPVLNSPRFGECGYGR